MRRAWLTLLAVTGVTLATVIPAAARALSNEQGPSSYDMLAQEAKFGLQWVTKPFNTRTAAYEDKVVSWPSVEPADDYTANSLMAFALGADQDSGLG